MSTTAAPPAAGAEGAAAASTKKVETVPADIRSRVLNGIKPALSETAEQRAAREKSEKDAADKKAAETAAAEKKKKDDEAAAANKNNNTPAPDKVRKVKSGPPLPDRPSPAAATSIEDAVRKVLPEITGAKTAASGPVDPDVQREIDLATFAEQKHGDRYAGMAQRVTEFYAARDQFVAKKAAELGGAKTPEFREWLEGDEFKGWVDQNRPAYARGDRAKLQEEAVADRARREAEEKIQPELKKLQRQTATLEHAPTINASVNAALRVVLTDPNTEKDPAMEGFAKDPQKFGDAHPEEAKIIAQEAAEAAELVREVFRIDLDLVDFDPKSPTPRQAQIRDFMVTQNAAFRAQYPSGLEMADGKILVDASTYGERGLEKDPRYRVFTAHEMAGMIAADRNARVLGRLKQRREGITKSIYVPKAPVAPPTEVKTKADDEPPAPSAGGRPAPGAPAKATENLTPIQKAKRRHL